MYYEDGSIQHAGVVIGFGGIAGHCFVQQPPGETGYCHRIICAQDYSAVTAACMMVKKSVYEAVHGFSEELEVAFNDIDFCMKVRQLGNWWFIIRMRNCIIMNLNPGDWRIHRKRSEDFRKKLPLLQKSGRIY